MTTGKLFVEVSNAGTHYYQLYFDGLQNSIPLFGNSFAMTDMFKIKNDEPEGKGNVCYMQNNNQWCKIGVYNTVGENIEIYIYQKGAFLATKNDGGDYKVNPLPVPTNALKKLGYDALINQPFPSNCKEIF